VKQGLDQSMFKLIFFFLLLLSNSVVAEVEISRIAKGLEKPLGVLPYPGSLGTLLLVEQGGKVKSFRNGKLVSKAFLDLSESILSGGEAGLLSLAFHPEFEKKSKIYVAYTRKNSSGKFQSVYSEFGVLKSKEEVDPETERILLVIDQPYYNHNGGQLAFGPDGFLYIGVGDGGSARDPLDHGLNPETLLGSLLRIDVNREEPYSIPYDNPFLKGTIKGKPEVYAWGLRNPWRFSFDSQDGKLWLADVGQNRFEEINIIEKGKNYGWAIFEAEKCLSVGPDCSNPDFVKPVFSYPRSEGLSITGGYVYRGKKVPWLEGKYIYGDYVSGKIWALSYDSEKKKVISNNLVADTKHLISSFGLDHQGEIYFVDHKEGSLHKLVPITKN